MIVHITKIDHIFSMSQSTQLRVLNSICFIEDTENFGDTLIVLDYHRPNLHQSFVAHRSYVDVAASFAVLAPKRVAPLRAVLTVQRMLDVLPVVLARRMLAVLPVAPTTNAVLAVVVATVLAVLVATVSVEHASMVAAVFLR